MVWAQEYQYFELEASTKQKTWLGKGGDPVNNLTEESYTAPEQES